MCTIALRAIVAVCTTVTEKSWLVDIIITTASHCNLLLVNYPRDSCVSMLRNIGIIKFSKCMNLQWRKYFHILQIRLLHYSIWEQKHEICIYWCSGHDYTLSTPLLIIEKKATHILYSMCAHTLIHFEIMPGADA